MQNVRIIAAALAIASTLILSGCGGADDGSGGLGGSGVVTTGSESTTGSTAGSTSTSTGTSTTPSVYPASGTYTISVTGTTALGGAFTLPGTLTVTPTVDTAVSSPNVVDVTIQIPQPTDSSANGILTYSTNSSLLPNATDADLTAMTNYGAVTASKAGVLTIAESNGPINTLAEFGSVNGSVSSLSEIKYVNATLTFTNTQQDVTGTLTAANIPGVGGSYPYSATFTGTLSSAATASLKKE